ncbi:hypothetical protein WDZ92_07180 [Nostoc sp. NIES-2111]
MTALMDWGCTLLGHASCEDASFMAKTMVVAGIISAIWLGLSLGIGLVVFVIKG